MLTIHGLMRVDLGDQFMIVTQARNIVCVDVCVCVCLCLVKRDQCLKQRHLYSYVKMTYNTEVRSWSIDRTK